MNSGYGKEDFNFVKLLAIAEVRAGLVFQELSQEFAARVRETSGRRKETWYVCHVCYTL